MTPVTAADRKTALGRLFRGIVHEASNALNVILMNAQLATVSAEDRDNSLETIIGQARRGGEFLKQLSAFAGAESFAPHAEATLADCIAQARRLLGATVRRSGTQLDIESSDSTTQRLDTIGLSVSLAVLLDTLCQHSASRIHVISNNNSIVISATDLSWPRDQQRDALATRLLQDLCAAHEGSYEFSENRWTLELNSR